jgi:putative acetyltransferase
VTSLTTDESLREVRTIIRPIEPRDDAAVWLDDDPRYGIAAAAAFAINDDSTLPIWDLYQAPRSAYFVAESDGSLIGGAGIAPLPCNFDHIAELQRFVLLERAGHAGLGRRLLDQCLDAADRFGFRSCYMELSAGEGLMIELLRVAGFTPVKPLRAPRTRGADTYYPLNLRSP